MTLGNTEELDLEGLEDFLSCTGHALVLGGPGSGKTTAALVKANQEIQESSWSQYQQVLFLSFARSTIARVSEAVGNLITKPMRRHVELTTYHSFVWRLIRSHGYLLQSDPPIRLLAPHDAVVRLWSYLRWACPECVSGSRLTTTTVNSNAHILVSPIP